MNTDSFIKKINFLKEGKMLHFKHEYLCIDVYVKMNPQQNRIYVAVYKNNNVITEEMLSYYLMWDCGDWYAVVEEPHVKYEEIYIEGVEIKL